MIVAVVALSAAAAILLAVVLVLATRRPAETDRERLLARDNERLQRALEETTDKLLHVIGKDFNVPPVDVDPEPGEDLPDPFEHFLSHDDLADVPLLLEPEPTAAGW